MAAQTHTPAHMAQHFKTQQQLEQLRALEGGGHRLLLPPEPAFAFAAWLAARARAARKQRDLATAMAAPESVYRRLLGVLLFASAASGALAISGVLTGATLNLFALLGALLGFNVVTLMLWAVFTALPGSHHQSVLNGALSWLLQLVFNRSNAHSARALSYRAWLQTTMAAPLAKWRLGVISHGLWCAFLAGNMVGLLFAFATRQFDFSWESTILAPATFVQLLQVLAMPLDALGLPVPEPFSASANAASRSAWAWFVMLCVLVYGLLPRTLALLVCRLVLWRKQRFWTPDYALPYYIDLKHRHAEQQRKTQVLDADTASRAPAPPPLAYGTNTPPPNALWVALEIPEHMATRLCPRPLHRSLDELHTIAAFQQQARERGVALVICVDGERTPDRGTVRKLRMLAELNPWLAVLAPASPMDAKQQAWLAAAAQANIAAAHTLRLEPYR